jgi:hypothetical protein
MAATSSNVGRFDIGAAYASIDTIGFDASYATGGYAVPTSVGIGANFGKLLGMAPLGMNTAGQGYVFTYNQQTSKMQLYWGGGSAAVLAEVTAGTSLATVTATVLSVGY